MTAKIASFVVATVLTLGSAQAFAQAERKDLQVFNDISDQVNRYTQFTIFDSISASVDQGLFPMCVMENIPRAIPCTN